MRLKTLLAIAALCACLTATTAFAQNLVNNGSFENGDFSGWVQTGDTSFNQVVSGPFYAYSGAEDGNFYATFGPVGDTSMLSQTFSDLAGAQYTFSFWLNAVGDDPSLFSASINGNNVLSLNNPSTGGVWTQFSFNFTGTGSDTIAFTFRDDPAWIALDNVSVTQSGSSVPEPSSFLLLGTGVLALGGIARRKLGL
jgi:carbohydrate binding protein with CBM4/9 domain/PEP-CTERM motif-containing protein